MDNVLESIKEIDPDLIVIDSIQTFTLEDFLALGQVLLLRQWNVQIHL